MGVNSVESAKEGQRNKANGSGYIDTRDPYHSLPRAATEGRDASDSNPKQQLAHAKQASSAPCLAGLAIVNLGHALDPLGD